RNHRCVGWHCWARRHQGRHVLSPRWRKACGGCMSATIQNLRADVSGETSSPLAMTAEERNDFMVGIAAAILNLKHPYEPHPDFAFHSCYRDAEIARQQT